MPPTKRQPLSGLDAFVDDIFSVLVQSSSQLTYKQAQQKARRFEAELNRLHKTFFHGLVDRSVGRKSAPTMGGYRPRWKALSRRYRDQKAKYGGKWGWNPDPVFYDKTGKMGQDLLSLRADRLWGKAVVRVSGLPRRGSGLTRSIQTSKTGTKFVRFRTGNRFATVAEVKEAVTWYFNVDLFDGVNEIIEAITKDEQFRLAHGNSTRTARAEARLLEDDELGYKLSNYRGDREREILFPYLRWYLTKQVTAIYRKYGSF